MRQDLQVDAGLVHLLEAELAKVVEALVHLGVAHLRAALLEMGRDFFVPVVLFEGDDFHGQILPLIRRRLSGGGQGDRWVTLVTGIANDLGMWDGQVPVLERASGCCATTCAATAAARATPGDYTIDLLVRGPEGAARLAQSSSDLAGRARPRRRDRAGVRHPPSGPRRQPDAVLLPRAMVPDFARCGTSCAARCRQHGLESIVEQTVQRWFSEDFKAAHPEVLEKVRTMIRRTTFEGYMGVTAAFLGLDWKTACPDTSPTLYVSGADDKLGGPPALMAGLAAKVQGARHVSVPNAAHIANIQNPEGFNRGPGGLPEMRLLLVLLFVSVAAIAQSYPSKPVRWIVPTGRAARSTSTRGASRRSSRNRSASR